MVTIQREMLATVAMDADALLEAHYRELCLHQDVMKLEPRWDQYAALERAGLLLVVAAREDGRLIGYSAAFIQPHLHYAAFVVAQSDVLYIDAEHRGSRTGLRLKDETEREAKAMGANRMVWRAKHGTALFNILSRQQQYTPEETSFGCAL